MTKVEKNWTRTNLSDNANNAIGSGDDPSLIEQFAKAVLADFLHPSVSTIILMTESNLV